MATLIDLIRSNIKDDSGKLTDPDDLINAATQALNRYSKARTLEVVVDIAGNGTHDVDLPIDWIDGFSSILQVEYPVDQVPAEIIDRRDYHIYTSPLGKKLRIITKTPTAAQSVRQTYTILHSEDSVPASDIEAVANLAASFCLLQLAAAYGNATDSTIQADSVQRQSKIDEYRRLAKEFEGQFNHALGLNNDDVTSPAMTVVNPVPASRRRSLRWR